MVPHNLFVTMTGTSSINVLPFDPKEADTRQTLSTAQSAEAGTGRVTFSKGGADEELDLNLKDKVFSFDKFAMVDPLESDTSVNLALKVIKNEQFPVHEKLTEDPIDPDYTNKDCMV